MESLAANGSVVPTQHGRLATSARPAQHAAGNFDKRHVETVCAASARVNVRIFYQPLTPPTALGLLGIAPRRASPGRAARGSVYRKMACRSCCGEHSFSAVQGHQLAHKGRGSLVAAPFQPEAGMDAKTRNLALLAALSLFCAGSAWSLGHLILGSVFFVLGVVAALGIAQKYWR